MSSGLTLLIAGDTVPAPNAVFDESGNFLLVPSLFGIKVINLTTNSVSRLLGKAENTERFLRIALWQGMPKKVSGEALLYIRWQQLCTVSHQVQHKLPVMCRMWPDDWLFWFSFPIVTCIALLLNLLLQTRLYFQLHLQHCML
jgi:hypothetical protein